MGDTQGSVSLSTMSHFYVELGVTIFLAYAVSELWRPTEKRWELLKALMTISWAGWQGVLLIVLSVTALALIAATAFVEPVHAHAGPATVLEREQKEQARKAVLTLCSFTALAYVDVRARTSPDKRVSCLWFARAAAGAAIKTIFVLAPLLAIIIALPYFLLASLLQSMGRDFMVVVGPLRFCTSYGPYVACYWVIKRDFARSPAAQLPLLPLSAADDKEHPTGGGVVSQWIASIRRDIELDANLRSAEPGSHRRCAMQLAKGMCAFWLLMVLYVIIIITMMPDEFESMQQAQYVARDSNLTLVRTCGLEAWSWLSRQFRTCGRMADRYARLEQLQDARSAGDGAVMHPFPEEVVI